ncbi:MAG: hypothetical protein K1060chlam4_00912 [Candidatus Anoxychlamydiales bacterium]|nr:hypothetical protein [Candidatus Anoxychlamydiales bacterium]
MSIRMPEAHRATYMEEPASEKSTLRHKVTPFKITKEHLDHPDEFCADDLLDESKIRFGEDHDGRIICSISLEKLKVGSSCYKVDCCKRVFSQNSLKGWLKGHSSCPSCTAHLITKNLLPYKDLIEKSKKIVLFCVTYYCVLVFDWYWNGKPENWLIDNTLKSLF